MRKLIAALFDNSPGCIFRAYMAVILIQFAFLSFCSVDLTVGGGLDLHDLVLAEGFWYGQLSLFGAASLILRKKLVSWKLGSFLGDAAAIVMFAFLSTEYLTSKPPIYAGGIMAGTAAAFLLGGLVYERRHA